MIKDVFGKGKNSSFSQLTIMLLPSSSSPQLNAYKSVKRVDAEKAKNARPDILPKANVRTIEYLLAYLVKRSVINSSKNIFSGK